MPRSLTAVLAALLLLCPTLVAQRADSARVAAGSRYAAGRLHRLLLGDSYRGLWTTPVAVPVLDPDTFAGGLTLEKQGGGLSTESLRMKAGNGREYVFRSVDKSVGQAMPADMRGTLSESVVQDWVAGKHPGGALVAASLLASAGVLHATPRLVVLPDHPFLGELRPQFRGRIGLLEERPTDGFAAAPDVKGSPDVRKLIEEQPRNRVDAHAFLTARLMDVLLGDWDRHWDQWRWARTERDGVRWWVPIPRDRDNAFNDNRGVIAGVGRQMTPILVHFGPEYDQILRYHQQPAELDRLLLAGLDRAAWDSTARWLRARLADPVVDSAVRRLPPEYLALNGAALATALKARRDALPEAASALYAILAREPELHATDAADTAEVVRLADGGVEVTVNSGGGALPLFQRRFTRDDTREVRLYLHGGDDHVALSGAASEGILVRVIGGGGDDVLDDRGGGGRRTVVYDDRGHNRIDRRGGVRVDTRGWQPPAPSTLTGNPPPVRDWGVVSSLTAPYVTTQSNVGPVIGLGPLWKRYGFRRVPYAELFSLQALWAPLEKNGFGGQLHYDRVITNRPARVRLDARGSNFENLRFHGFGNQSPADPGGGTFVVDQTQLRAVAALELRPAAGLTVFFGPAAKWTDPGEVQAVPAADPLRGRDTFWQLGGAAGAELDRRDSMAWPRRGVHARLDASGYGTDLGGPFARLEGEAAWYASLPGAFGPTLALRAGGQHAFGGFPFQESAFLGGSRSLRGYSNQRFRGDAALYGSGELRARLAYLHLGVIRTHLGAFVLGDAGRVYLDGASPGGWHTGVGGGLSFLSVGHSATVAFAHGERNQISFTVGMPY